MMDRQEQILTILKDHEHVININALSGDETGDAESLASVLSADRDIIVVADEWTRETLLRFMQLMESAVGVRTMEFSVAGRQFREFDAELVNCFLAMVGGMSGLEHISFVLGEGSACLGSILDGLAGQKSNLQSLELKKGHLRGTPGLEKAVVHRFQKLAFDRVSFGKEALTMLSKALMNSDILHTLAVITCSTVKDALRGQGAPKLQQPMADSDNFSSLKVLKMMESPTFPKYWERTGVLHRLSPEMFEFEGPVMLYVSDFLERSASTRLKYVSVANFGGVDLIMYEINNAPCLSEISLKFQCRCQFSHYLPVQELFEVLRAALNKSPALTTITLSICFAWDTPDWFSVDQQKELQYLVACNRIQLRMMSERTPLETAIPVLGGQQHFQHGSTGFSCETARVTWGGRRCLL